MSVPLRCHRRYRSLHWCGIGKGFPQIARDAVFGREVELLEELGGNGDASGGPDTVQSCPIRLLSTHCEVVVVQVSIAIALGEVFFHRWTVVVDGVLEWTVVVHGRHCGCGVAGTYRLEAAVGMLVRRNDSGEEIARRQLLAEDKEEKELETVRQGDGKLQTRGSRAPLQLSTRWKSSIDLHRHLWSSSFPSKASEEELCEETRLLDADACPSLLVRPRSPAP